MDHGDDNRQEFGADSAGKPADDLAVFLQSVHKLGRIVDGILAEHNAHFLRLFAQFGQSVGAVVGQLYHFEPGFAERQIGQIGFFGLVIHFLNGLDDELEGFFVGFGGFELLGQNRGDLLQPRKERAGPGAEHAHVSRHFFKV